VLDVPVVLADPAELVVPAVPSGHTIQPIEVALLMAIALQQTNSAALHVVIH
jgi:hypothetical protein